ncbi:MAG: aspartate--tRNA ligase [Actinomycetia bacterium]|nr:aspartate--tRNA ligase [Actinomycetes bacterium]
MEFSRKTHNCGEIRVENIGEEVELYGWIHRRRDHGGLIFLDLRDRSGLIQIEADPDISEEAFKNAEKIRNEFVVRVNGSVKKRPEGTVNPNLPTGQVEVKAKEIKILSISETPPFEVEDQIEVDEVLRMKYRYIDLRRFEMLKNIILRHKVVQEARDFLNRNDFLEIETPCLTKSTPEGARDFLVPSRLQKGYFFALPQSPQLFKQILMVAGMERYYQLARCFRDEDLRADRQPEHTQIDIEMSFVSREDIINLIENLIKKTFSLVGVDLKLPFRRMTYEEAIKKYGTDKPDLRYGLEIDELTKLFKETEFKVFQSCIKSSGIIAGLKIKSLLSRSKLDELTDWIIENGAKGLVWMVKEDTGIKSPIIKFLSNEEVKSLEEQMDMKKGEVLFIIAGEKRLTFHLLGMLRVRLAQELNLIKKEEYKTVWVTDFPLFEYDEEEKRLKTLHHPFTKPTEDTVNNLKDKPLKVKADAYDVVINGLEIGGGSLRIYHPKQQKKVFSLLGLEDKEILEKFGFLIEAFKYGVPPHGGIALGLDRLVMIISKKATIRDVIAFPKTSSANCPLTDAPDLVDEKQLKILGLRLS